MGTLIRIKERLFTENLGQIEEDLPSFYELPSAITPVSQDDIVDTGVNPIHRLNSFSIKASAVFQSNGSFLQAMFMVRMDSAPWLSVDSLILENSKVVCNVFSDGNDTGIRVKNGDLIKVMITYDAEKNIGMSYVSVNNYSPSVRLVPNCQPFTSDLSNLCVGGDSLLEGRLFGGTINSLSVKIGEVWDLDKFLDN